MALTAIFYNFSKRANSTKVPDANVSGTTYNVVLKMPTSRRQPTLRISADTFNFNYCRFEGSFYFVEDIVSVRENLFDVTMRKDVLGTFRAQILAQSAYVMYDSTGNAEIVDNRLAIKTSRTIRQNYAAFPAVNSAGTYVLSCVGQHSCASWWNIDPYSIELSVIYSKAYDAVEEPFTPSSWVTAAPEAIAYAADYIGKLITKAFSYLLSNGNAIDAIRNCIWIPFRPVVTAAGGRIFLGNYDTGIDSNRITEPVVHLDQVTVNIPWQASDWRRNAPYHQVYLYIPFIGVVQLPAAQLTGAEAITIDAALNVISGDLSVNILNAGQIIGSYGANVAMNVPIGSSNAVQRDVVNTVVGAASGAVTAMAGLGIAAGAAALSGVAGAAAGQIAGVPTSVGGLSNGSAAKLSTNIICFTSFHDTNVSPASVAAEIGLPAFRVEQIGSVSGYIQTHEFSFQGEALREDYEEINNYLNGGAFIE